MEAEHSPALKHLIWNLKKDYSHQRGTLCCFFYLTFDPQIALLMNAAGNGHLLSRVLYPDTGHLIEPPYSPHFRASNFKAAGVATKTGESSWHRVTQALWVFFSVHLLTENQVFLFMDFFICCVLWWELKGTFYINCLTIIFVLQWCCCGEDKPKLTQTLRKTPGRRSYLFYSTICIPARLWEPSCERWHTNTSLQEGSEVLYDIMFTTSKLP